MAERITAMVNEVLAEEEPGSKALTEDDVLALIDTGGSEGGSQVRCARPEPDFTEESAPDRPHAERSSHQGHEQQHHLLAWQYT